MRSTSRPEIGCAGRSRWVPIVLLLVTGEAAAQSEKKAGINVLSVTYADTLLSGTGDIAESCAPLLGRSALPQCVKEEGGGVQLRLPRCSAPFRKGGRGGGGCRRASSAAQPGIRRGTRAGMEPTSEYGHFPLPLYPSGPTVRREIAMHEELSESSHDSCGPNEGCDGHLQTRRSKHLPCSAEDYEESPEHNVGANWSAADAFARIRNIFQMFVSDAETDVLTKGRRSAVPLDTTRGGKAFPRRPQPSQALYAV
ncbi:hypothetical protein HPB51_009261 [Rhipicephalus microplus]|uniref:Uncharacterized protein n=1 Tax=Rhipicephalus microplus TaxID=6941 RepID=A0A9J6F0Q3_RHIMP|nr:hypothetical protein HPB51_009261 [Rhipicephalus microplus]